MVRKLTASVVIAALAGAASLLAVRSAASAQPSFHRDRVFLVDSDAGRALFRGAPLTPGESRSSCIRVTREGSSEGPVKLYGHTGGSGLDRFLRLTVVRGWQDATHSACRGFRGRRTLFTGTLRQFPDDYAGGVVDPGWGSGGSRAYRFTVMLLRTSAVQGLTASQTFEWEARAS